MGYERYPRGTEPQDDHYRRNETRDYGTSRDYGYSAARDDRATRDFGRDRGGYGTEYGRSSGEWDSGQRYGARSRYGAGDEHYSSYAADRDRYDRDRGGYSDRGTRGQQGQQRSYGRQPQGYDYDDRGFLARAGDEVRSWFGDEDAEHRRELDNRYDERSYADRDHDYHNWRSGQIAALDRDYHEYRQENRSRFENEFSTWRSQRQTQRNSLDSVKEHNEVLGSDGSHVGTVDKVRGDRILLTKNDADAGGQHHSIPSRWIQSVDGEKVTLTKTADEAKLQWRAEEKNRAMFDYGDNADTRKRADPHTDSGGHILNRSFSGTY